MTQNQTKNVNFTLFFNYKDELGNIWAEQWREDSCVYLREAFKRCSAVAREAVDLSETSLRLRGFVSMKNRCTQSHIKKILGKYSHCKQAPFGDFINVIQCFTIDRQMSLTGRLATTDMEDVRTVMRVIQGSEKWGQRKDEAKTSVEETKKD